MSSDGGGIAAARLHSVERALTPPLGGLAHRPTTRAAATRPSGSASAAATSSTPAVTSRMRRGVVEGVAGRPARLVVAGRGARAVVGQQLDRDRREARLALDAAQVALGGGDLARDEAQPRADARGLVAVVALASWRSRLRALGAGVLSRDRTETTAPVMSCAPGCARAPCATSDSRLSALCSCRSGTRSSNSPLEPDDTWEETTKPPRSSATLMISAAARSMSRGGVAMTICAERST